MIKVVTKGMRTVNVELLEVEGFRLSLKVTRYGDQRPENQDSYYVCLGLAGEPSTSASLFLSAGDARELRDMLTMGLEAAARADAEAAARADAEGGAA